METKYQDSKIYKITSPQSDKYYIGSTYLPLKKRLTKHMDSYKCYLNNKYHYVSSFEILKFEDHIIELIELYPCNSKTELELREGIVQREHAMNIVNYRIAGRTGLDYRRDTVQHKKEYDIQYRAIQPKILCVCGKSYASRHKTCHEKTKLHIKFMINNKNIKI